MAEVGQAGVSSRLEQAHGVRIQPGGKGVCPFCRHNTFAVRKDDSVGKCFHPSCGRFVTTGSARSDYRGSLYEIFDRIKQDCHDCLVKQADATSVGYAWQFLVEARKIHPNVIRDLTELGAVPKDYKLTEAFKPTVNQLCSRKKDLTEKIVVVQGQRKQLQQRAKTEQEKAWEKQINSTDHQLGFLKAQFEHLKEKLSHVGGWLAFFHTDQHHRVCSIRFRKATAAEKAFQSHIPMKESYGLFGHALFRPFQSESKCRCNRLVVVEGEFNLLQIQSLAVRTGGDAGGEGYANWVAATGSANTLDQRVIEGLLTSPDAVRPALVIQDNDDAGDGMVDALARSLTLEVVKPPQRDTDIDDFIRSYENPGDALRELHRLIAGRSIRWRPYDALAEQVFCIRQNEEEKKEFEVNAAVTRIVVRDLTERGTFYHQGRDGFYFLNDEKRLVPLSDSDKQVSCLLAKYGLNPSEDTFRYVWKALHIEALTQGSPDLRPPYGVVRQGILHSLSLRPRERHIPHHDRCDRTRGQRYGRCPVPFRPAERGVPHRGRGSLRRPV